MSKRSPLVYPASRSYRLHRCIRPPHQLPQRQLPVPAQPLLLLLRLVQGQLGQARLRRPCLPCLPCLQYPTSSGLPIPLPVPAGPAGGPAAIIPGQPSQVPGGAMPMAPMPGTLQATPLILPMPLVNPAGPQAAPAAPAGPAGPGVATPAVAAATRHCFQYSTAGRRRGAPADQPSHAGTRLNTRVDGMPWCELRTSVREVYLNPKP